MTDDTRNLLGGLIEGQEALTTTIAAVNESVLVAVAQGSQILRLMTAPRPERDGPTLDEFMEQILQVLRGQTRLLTEIRDAESRRQETAGVPTTTGRGQPT